RITTRRVSGIRFGQSKVEQSNLGVRRKLQIVWFDIAMDDLTIARVQVDKRIKQLIGPGNHVVLWKRPRSSDNNRSQVDARDKLHHQERSVTFGEVITDPW